MPVKPNENVKIFAESVHLFPPVMHSDQWQKCVIRPNLELGAQETTETADRNV
jgi:hypothetical protein